MLHTKFRANRPAGSGEEDLKVFYGGHLGHLTSIISSDFHFRVHESFYKIVQIVKVISEKIQFEYLYVHDLGPRSRNDLDLHTHIPSYILLDVCSNKLSSHWLQ